MPARIWPLDISTRNAGWLEKKCRLSRLCRPLVRLAFPSPHADLAVALINRDAEAFYFGSGAAEGLEKLVADVGGEKFGRRIRDWEDAAVARGKDPAAFFECDRYFAAVVGDTNLRMLRGEQHVVI